MNIPELKKALNEGVVLFQFQKIDGSLRDARGTTCPELIPTDNMPKGVRTPEQQAAYARQTVAFYPSRKNRIARGAGVDIAEVNRLVKQFEQMQKMMKQMPGLRGKRHGNNPFASLPGRRGGFPF